MEDTIVLENLTSDPIAYFEALASQLIKLRLLHGSYVFKMSLDEDKNLSD